MLKLKILYQNTRQELQRDPCQSLAAASVIIAAIFHIGVTLMDYKAVSSNPIIILMQETVEGNLLLLLMSTSLLVWSLTLLIKRHENIKELVTQSEPLTLEMLQFKKWEEIEKQYEEQELVPGFSLRANIASLGDGESPKYACPACYVKQQISHLVCERNTPELGVFSCLVCGSRPMWNRHDYSK